MDKIINKILTACIGKAREGNSELNVFDLMYETSLPYPELKDILDKLISENELVQSDLKTYRFIGETDRDLDSGEKLQPYEPVFENVETSSGREKAFEVRREYLEQRRKEMLEFLEQKQTEEEHVEDEEEPITDLSDYVIDVFSEKLSPDVFIEPPLHPSWKSKSEFMQSCADNLIILMNSDKQMGRVKAIKKARILLGELQKSRNVKTAEVYEYIVYGLSYMSNYYYNKIRENLV